MATYAQLSAGDKAAMAAAQAGASNAVILQAAKTGVYTPTTTTGTTTTPATQTTGTTGTTTTNPYAGYTGKNVDLQGNVYQAGKVVGNVNTPTAPTAPKSTQTVVTSSNAIQDLTSKKAVLEQQLADLQAQAKIKAQPVTPVADLKSTMAQSGEDASFTNRKNLATQYGITNYTGTPEQDAQLQTALQNKANDLKTQVANLIKQQQPEAPVEKPVTPEVEYQNKIDDLNNKSDEAYTDFNNQLSQIRNGTFPLSASEQALIDATNNALTSAKKQQLLANENYVSGITQAGIAAGRSRYAPEIEQGNIYNAVSAGITKIQDLENKAVQEIATLKQGFDTQNYNLINAAYTAFTNYTKQKTDTLMTMHTQVMTAENNLRNYNLDVQKQKDTVAYQKQQIELRKQELANAGHFTMSTDAYGNPVVLDTRTGTIKALNSIDGSGNVSGKGLSDPSNSIYNMALTNASNFGNIPVTKIKETRGAVDAALKNGNVKDALVSVLSVAAGSLPPTEKLAAVKRAELIGSLNDIKTDINAYEKTHPGTNIFSGTLENAIQLIGTTSDPQLASIKLKMNSLFIDYRQSKTGAVFTRAESNDYQKVMPSIMNIGSLNLLKMNTMIDMLNVNEKSALAYTMGGNDVYDRLVGNHETGNNNTQYDSINAIVASGDADKIAAAKRMALATNPNTGKVYTADEILSVINNQPDNVAPYVGNTETTTGEAANKGLFENLEGRSFFSGIEKKSPLYNLRNK